MSRSAVAVGALAGFFAAVGISGEPYRNVPSGGVVLVQFISTRCPHCRAMQPVIQQLVQQGLRVETVDVDRQAELAAQHQITAVPTFVARRGSREVGRQVGVAHASQLVALCGLSGGGGDRSVPATASAEAGSLPEAADFAVVAAGARAASVRLRVEDAGGFSFGTGTIIDQHQQEALVITCGHLFRSSGGRGKITADLFVGSPQSVEGRLLAYDLERDVALVSLHGCPPVQPARVAPPGHTVRPGDMVFSVGCDRGAEPTIRPTRITAVNKYRGKPNYTAAGQPVDGRSGGGLFTADGLLIGVCNAADPAEDEGLYAALPSIQWQLDQVGLAEVYQRPARLQEGTVVASTPPATSGQAAVHDADRAHPVAQTSQTLAGQIPSSAMDRAAEGEWELVVIVRSKRDPSRQSEVYVVDAASGGLMEQITLAAQQTGQRRAALASSASMGSAGVRSTTGGSVPPKPVVRAQSAEQP